jgi:dUTP pyrophosphatase
MFSRDFLKFKLMRPGAVLPKRATDGSGAFDFYAPEDIFLDPKERKLIPSGVAHEMPGTLAIPFTTIADLGRTALFQTPFEFHIPVKMQGVLFDRSGLGGKKGVRLSFACLIDNDYRGEILLSFENTSNDPFWLQKGERMCQIAYVPMYCGPAVEAEHLSETARGEGGFGSTGK